MNTSEATLTCSGTLAGCQRAPWRKWDSDNFVALARTIADEHFETWFVAVHGSQPSMLLPGARERARGAFELAAVVGMLKIQAIELDEYLEGLSDAAVDE